jgi:hypothetical protein
MTTYERQPKCADGMCTPYDQAKKHIGKNNAVFATCLLCNNYVNKLKCAGGCAPFAQCTIKTSNAGKEYRTCPLCENYVNDPASQKGGQKRAYGTVLAAPMSAPSTVDMTGFVTRADYDRVISNLNTRVGVLEMKLAVTAANHSQSQH